MKFPEFLNKDKKSHLPTKAAKRLIHGSFFTGIKVSKLAGRG
jgi:hypothetical protein